MFHFPKLSLPASVHCMALSVLHMLPVSVYRTVENAFKMSFLVSSWNLNPSAVEGLNISILKRGSQIFS